jgi:hypothetical protein
VPIVLKSGSLNLLEPSGPVKACDGIALLLLLLLLLLLDRDSSDGIATRYVLGGPGIESRWGQGFPQSSRPALEPNKPPIDGYRLSFWGVKRPGRCVDHATLSSVEAKERVKLYIYCPTEPSWPVLG